MYEQGQGTLEDNEIYGNMLSGIGIATGGNLLIRRNRIYANMEHGLYVHQQSHAVLEGNEISGNMYAGVSSSTQGGLMVRQNRIIKNGYTAVKVCRNGGGTFENNDLRDNTRGAWYIEQDCLPNVTRRNNTPNE